MVAFRVISLLFSLDLATISSTAAAPWGYFAPHIAIVEAQFQHGLICIPSSDLIAIAVVSPS